MKGTPDFVLVSTSNRRDFALRREAQDSDDLVVIRFADTRRGLDNARRSTIFFRQIENFGQLKLVALNPEKGPDGDIVHNFGGKFAMKSGKNAAFVAHRDGSPLVTVRKVAKDILEIDIQIPHEPVWVLAIGASVFVSKAR